MIKLIKENKAELIVGIIFIFFALGFNVYRVQSDGFIYYSFLERILHIPSPEFPSSYSNSGFRQAGCAFFNAPFYLCAYLIENLLHMQLNFNGITLRQISINLASNFYLLISLILSIKILKILKFKFIISPALLILFSTSAFMAAVIVPSFSHAVDIFVLTLFIYLFIKNEDARHQKSFWLGILYVISILVRYFNAVLIFPVLIYYLLRKDYQRIKYFIYGVIAFGWILPLILYIFNGSPFSLTRSVRAESLIKQTLPVFPKYILKPLIHPLHGLFIWSPVTILSLFGLATFPKEKARYGYLFLGIWAMFLVELGYMPFWYGGWSFSSRYLVSLFPIFIIGLASFLQRHDYKMCLFGWALTIYSIFVFLNWYLCIFQPEFETPGAIVRAWSDGRSTFSPEVKVNAPEFFRSIWNVCRYKYIFKIF